MHAKQCCLNCSSCFLVDCYRHMCLSSMEAHYCMYNDKKCFKILAFDVSAHPSTVSLIIYRLYAATVLSYGSQPCLLLRVVCSRKGAAVREDQTAWSNTQHRNSMSVIHHTCCIHVCHVQKAQSCCAQIRKLSGQLLALFLNVKVLS